MGNAFDDSKPVTPWLIVPREYRPPAKQEDAGVKLQDHELTTEYGNAQRFVHQHGSKVRYCHSEKQWYIWTGRIWQPDTENQVEILAMNTAKSIFTEASSINDAVARAKLVKWSQSSMSEAKVKKMLKLSASLLPVKVDQFDADKWKISALNGRVDLVTGELLPHNQEAFATKMCNAQYVPDAECPIWDKFMDRIFDGNKALIRYVQKMVGYMLTGAVTEKCFFILHGEKGDNGKTVFINTLMEVFDDYAMQTPIDTLLRRKAGSQSNDIVRLNKARFVSSAEANKQCYFDEALVKRLTGDDPVTARLLFKEHITFKPECKIVIATNRVPRFDRADTAFNNRVRIVPFNVSIPVEEQDRNLKDKLMLEADGILAWAVRGCLLWQEEGLGLVPVAEEPHVEVRPDSSVDNFVHTRCVRGDSYYTKTQDLHEAYLAYHAEVNDGTDPIGIAALGVKLGELGFLWAHGRDGNGRAGIALRSSVDSADSSGDKEVVPLSEDE